MTLTGESEERKVDGSRSELVEAALVVPDTAVPPNVCVVPRPPFPEGWMEPDGPRVGCSDAPGNEDAATAALVTVPFTLSEAVFDVDLDGAAALMNEDCRAAELTA